MRILFTYTNRNRFLSPAPIGAMLIADSLRQDNHDIRFVDLMFENNPRKTLETAIEEHNPEFMCFSVRNIDNMDARDLKDPLPEIGSLIRHARTLCDAPVLIGGTAVSTFPVQMRAAMNADYSFDGNDPELIKRFVASFQDGDVDTSIPGLVYQNGESVHHNEPQICGYRGVSFAGFDLLDLKKYRKSYFDCGVVTHSGCPMRCSYCDAHRTFGGEYKLRDPKEVVEEIKELKDRYRARSIWLINAGLNRPLEFGKELLARIIEENARIGFSCIIEPGLMDEQFAFMLRKAGCQIAMIFGSSLSDQVLEQNRSFYRWNSILHDVRTLDTAGVSYMLGAMFGLPGETLKTVDESLNNSLEIKPVMTQLGVGFRIQPQTPLYDIAVQEGVISADDDCFRAKFYCSNEASLEQIHKKVRAFNLRHPWHKLRMLKFIGRSIIDSMIQKR